MYSEHLTYLQKMAHAVHHGHEFPVREIAQDKAIDVIGSLPVMRASSEAYKTLKDYHQAKAEGKSPAQIEAAKQVMEAALVELNVRMRDDLRLNTGAGQFPNAEVFRAKRGT